MSLLTRVFFPPDNQTLPQAPTGVQDPPRRSEGKNMIDILIRIMQYEMLGLDDVRIVCEMEIHIQYFLQCSLL